jgi:hypothetical protein
LFQAAGFSVGGRQLQGTVEAGSRCGLVTVAQRQARLFNQNLGMAFFRFDAQFSRFGGKDARRRDGLQRGQGIIKLAFQ